MGRTVRVACSASQMPLSVETEEAFAIKHERPIVGVTAALPSGDLDPAAFSQAKLNRCASS